MKTLPIKLIAVANFTAAKCPQCDESFNDQYAVPFLYCAKCELSFLLAPSYFDCDCKGAGCATCNPRPIAPPDEPPARPYGENPDPPNEVPPTPPTAPGEIAEYHQYTTKMPICWHVAVCGVVVKDKLCGHEAAALAHKINEAHGSSTPPAPQPTPRSIMVPVTPATTTCACGGAITKRVDNQAYWKCYDCGTHYLLQPKGS